MIPQIDATLQRIEHLAEQLRADPDGHVRRSALELREAFGAGRGVEPAVARMRESVRMLRRGNQDGSRREFQRREVGLDQLDDVLEYELLPALRQGGFSI